ncbi:MAG TPA: hypothetical protein VMS22_07310 [Candidatus Eisenbacteria bacterium]|nr:hypothetical protein [Candidatus Eisenbacteria bacterium]
MGRLALVVAQSGELLVRFLAKHLDPPPGVCFDPRLRTAERDLNLRDRSGQPLDALLDVDPTDPSGS